MIEFEPFETTHEGQLYKRIGILETELATAHKRIVDLEKQSDLWEKRAKATLKTLIIALVIALVLGLMLMGLGAYLIWRY